MNDIEFKWNYTKISKNKKFDKPPKCFLKIIFIPSSSQFKNVNAKQMATSAYQLSTVLANARVVQFYV